jgi:hypothetical protein
MREGARHSGAFDPFPITNELANEAHAPVD